MMVAVASSGSQRHLAHSRAASGGDMADDRHWGHCARARPFSYTYVTRNLID